MKRRRRTKRDMISFLPDPIQNHIVSFLGLKDAIKTKTLSRQWRNICYSLSSLDFCQSGLTPRKFRNIVDEVLILHNGSDIQDFTLSAELDKNIITPIHVRSWVSFAIQHNVENFQLCVCGERFDHLPSCLFTSTTLRKLKLNAICIGLALPTAVSFPGLKSLELDNITLCNENIINSLFSSKTFPVLEDLNIESCTMKIDTLSISISSLKNFRLCDFSIRFDDEQDYKVQLTFQNLQTVHYDCRVAPDVSSCNLSSVVQSNFFEFSLPSSSAKEPGGASFHESASMILLGMTKVRNILLGDGFLENLARDQHFLSSWPVFQYSLTEISLVWYPLKSHAIVVLYLLCFYPNMETLYLEAEPVWDDRDTDAEEPWHLDELDCRYANEVKNLRTVTLSVARGCDSELNMAEYLLDYASNLQTLNINYTESMEKEVHNRNRVSKKVLSFKGQKDVKINFNK